MFMRSVVPIIEDLALADARPRAVLSGSIFSLLLAVLAVGTACTGSAAPPPEPAVPEADALTTITRPGDGGAVHLIRLVQQGDNYAFDPAEITIPSGDVVRFVMGGEQPESVVFDADQATPAEAAEFVQGHDLHRGILLTRPGQAYDVPFRDAPPGRYPIHSLPHSERGMRGVITVRGAD